MGLLEQEINELRELNALLDSGGVTPEQVNAKIAIYSQTEKRAKMMINLFGIKAKNPAMKKEVNGSSLIGGEDLVLMIDTSMIHCPAKAQSIDREACLDLSGKTEPPEECGDCKHFKTTRTMLLGDK